MIDKLLLPKIAASLSWRLARFGVRVAPYYWFLEGSHAVALPVLEEARDFSFGFFEAGDLRALAAAEPDAFPEEHLAEYLARLRRGKLFFGAKYRDEVVAMTFVDLDEADYLGRVVRLASDEAYLGDMFTRQKFRGRNIAPYLRSKAYEALRAMGKARCYSYSDAFNAAALRFKDKLGARALWLGIYFEIFGKYRWHWKLKSYDD